MVQVENQTNLIRMCGTLNVSKDRCKKIDYELRTTFAPKLPSSVDVVTIAKQIRGAKNMCYNSLCQRLLSNEVRGPKTALA
jgi:hypothetical protein